MLGLLFVGIFVGMQCSLGVVMLLYLGRDIYRIIDVESIWWHGLANKPADQWCSTSGDLILGISRQSVECTSGGLQYRAMGGVAG